MTFRAPRRFYPQNETREAGLNAVAAAEERLRIEAAQRDPSHFRELYEAHFERVYAYAMARVRARHDAEDVTSEVFQQALANLHRFEWRGVPFAAWLLRIATNTIVDRAKRAARETELPDPEAEPDRVFHLAEERALLYRRQGAPGRPAAGDRDAVCRTKNDS